MKNLVSACAALAFLATPVLADHDHLRAKSILGSKVSLKGGTSVGTIEDIIFSSEGVVDYVVVSDGGKLRTLPWEVAKFDHGKRVAVVDVETDVYKKVPTYTVERYPTFYAPTYRTEVYKAWGLRPGEIRRLDRRSRRP
ncbi:MAG: PRC-barrel domain-containing protein [Gemmataceae bacterium]|nr:PRC-barrel domain-containing protein [Gemmataceae bacterium]